jgi:hypothetical protein
MIALGEARPTGRHRELGHDGARVDAREREVSQLAVVTRDRCATSRACVSRFPQSPLGNVSMDWRLDRARDRRHIGPI